MLPISIIDLQTDVPSLSERERLCRLFYSELYLASFPDPNQQEAPENWLALMAREGSARNPTLHLLIAQQDLCSPTTSIIGGALIEYYRRSKAALLTYLVVSKTYRKQGLGRRLLTNAVACVTRDNDHNRPLIFAETEWPPCSRTRAERRNAEERLIALSALGGLRVNITYIQPRLGPARASLHNLVLVFFPPDPRSATSVGASRVLNFMDEFYDSLGQRGSVDHRHIVVSVTSDLIPLSALHSR